MSESDQSDTDRDPRRLEHCNDNTTTKPKPKSKDPDTFMGVPNRVALVPSRASFRPVWSKRGIKKRSDVPSDPFQPKRGKKLFRAKLNSKYQSRVLGTVVDESSEQRSLRMNHDNPCSCPTPTSCQCPSIKYAPDSKLPVSEPLQSTDCFCKLSGNCKCPKAIWGGSIETDPSHGSLKNTDPQVQVPYNPGIRTVFKNVLLYTRRHEI